MFHLKIFSGYLSFIKDIAALERTDAFYLTSFYYVRRRGFGGRFGIYLGSILLGNGDLILSSHMQNLRKLEVFA
jgi:hypothetical protein